MLGGANIKEMVDKSIGKLYDDIKPKVDRSDSDKIHALEASQCVRLSYYERKDPKSDDISSKMSTILNLGFRKSLGNIHGEYKLEGMTLEVDADIIVENQFLVRFELVPELPEVPHPRHMLYLNACLFAFNKDDGVLIYITPAKKTVEFSINKNNRMFEEIVRRARVLSTLLKDSKVPIVEPCDMCIGCKYYERCYAKEKKSDGGFNIEDLFGSRKED